MSYTCATEDCNNPIENRDTGLCASCSKANRKLEADTRKQALKKASQKQIAKVSDKMAAALREYSKASKQFLKQNPKCIVFPNLPAVEVHHGKGRATIELLLDQQYWKPVSREGHTWIHANPQEAIERGFSYSRLWNEQTTRTNSRSHSR